MRFLKNLRALPTAFLIAGLWMFCSILNTCAQGQDRNWQEDVRKLVQQQNWESAMHIVDDELARTPHDLDAHLWRARIFTWSGQLQAAEKEYRRILEVDSNDPDNWLGLATVLQREGRSKDALAAMDRSVQLDPRRADLRITRGRILRAQGNRAQARAEFQKALQLDPSDGDARAGLLSLQDAPKHTLRFGEDNDLFNFTGANHAEWVNVFSSWTPRWNTSFGTGVFQRGGLEATKFEGSVTAHIPRLAAITVGGAGAHDNGVIPASEAFFDLDRGWNLSESAFLRGLEIAYNQHWYWYTTARILTLNQTGIVYLPREWTWTLRLTQARSHFSGTDVDWKTSGMSRLDFPLATWKSRSVSGNVFYAVGTEDFARVDQIGSFSSQNYGGGLRFRMTPRQELGAYSLYQRRTQSRTQTSFGFSYAVHF